MLIVGLTGSIGMGKSETARMFREAGVPVFDADGTVHALQSPGSPALPLIEKYFPGSVVDGELDRAALGARVFGNPEELRKLEAIMHPMVGGMRKVFLRNNREKSEPLVVLDEPLLFEMDMLDQCDHILVVSAPADVQRERVMARAGMTEQKYTDIMARQVPDADKRAKADYIVESHLGLDHAEAQVLAIITGLKDKS